MDDTVREYLLHQGAVRAVRRIILRVGNCRFGFPASWKIRCLLDDVTDLETLEQMALDVLTADSWESLLGLPPRRTRRRS